MYCTPGITALVTFEGAVRTMAIHELSALLWRERELLDVLTFKLEEEQLLLTSGKSRWLPHGTKEVEQVLGHLSQASLARTIEAAVVAEVWGLPPMPPWPNWPLQPRKVPGPRSSPRTSPR